MKSIVVNGMKGLGDNIYQRAFISAIQDFVFLETPWPQLYEDLPNVKFLKCETKLRTQLKNIQSGFFNYEKPTSFDRQIKVEYSKIPILTGMKNCFGFSPNEMELPSYGKIEKHEPYVLIRPVTVRKEWVAETRNPLPEYVKIASEMAKNFGYKVISVADLQDGEEWVVGELPCADESYHKGELSVKQLLSLVENAAGVIGGIGWITPAAMAYKKAALIVCGGQGLFNSPKNIVDPRLNLKDLNIVFAVPDKFCMCSLKSHNCNKVIKNYERIFTEWFQRLPALV